MDRIRRVAEDADVELPALPDDSSNNDRPTSLEKVSPSLRSSGNLLRCESCGAVQTAATEDLLRYSETGWPKCCRQIMTLFTETEHP